MCGIAGFVGPFGFELLQKMADSIRYRGPDDFGFYHDPEHCVGLAHRRLSIIDLSNAGHQPMWNKEHTIAIVFNGEIYNYRELKKEMESIHIQFESSSDTEVLLKLYEVYGSDLLSKLNGIFAFAIWDSSVHRLFCARDHFGVKPFYYYHSGNRFIFSSELKAILCEPSVERTIDCESVHYYVTYLWSPSPNTMLTSVKKLKPGHAIIINCDGTVVKHWQYYDIPYKTRPVRTPVSQAVENVEFYLRQAVQRQMVADVEVGAFLSGGLDSSSIVHFARSFSRSSRFQCFTIKFTDNSLKEEGFINDLPYAEAVSRHLGTKLNIVDVDSKMAVDLLETIYHLDEPQADPAAINVRYISRLAKQNGIKVLLSGAGGDDVFSGYRRHIALMHEYYWKWMPLLLRNGLHALSEISPSHPGYLRRFKKAFAYANYPAHERIASYFHWLTPDVAQSLFSKDILQSIENSPFSKPLMDSLNPLRNIHVHPLNKMLYLEMKHFLADHNLNYTDKMSMAEGVEVRVPFLDKDLVEYSYTLPIGYKIRGTTAKWILKKSMERYLPKEIIYRPKTGFGVPLRRWISHELSEYVNEILSEESIKARGIFSYSGVKALIERDKRRHIDASYIIYSLISIELWCRTFIDNTKPL
jgi:asparagine synthase (glutamine-hydrolysing)